MKDNNFNFNQVFLNTLDSSATLAPYKSSIEHARGGIPSGYVSEQLLAFLHLNNISANISEKSLSILLAKASFAFLLISMLSYWFQMSFKSQIVMNNSVRRIPSVSLWGTHTNRRFVKGTAVLTNKEVFTPESPHISLTQQLRCSFPYKSSYKSSICTSKGLRLEDLADEPIGNEQRSCCVNDMCGLASTATWKKSTLVSILGKIPVISMWSANITLALLLSIRWIESGHFPLSNLYESLIFLSWSLTAIHLFLENLFYKNSLREHILCSSATVLTPEGVYKAPSVLGTRKGTGSAALKGVDNVWVSDPTLTLGAITSPVALFTNAFATFSLPQEMQKVTVLVPALKSNWLIMHVSVMIISYAALLSGSLLAMAFLVLKVIDELRRNNEVLNPLQVAELTTCKAQGLRLEDVSGNEQRSCCVNEMCGHTPYKSSICKGSAVLTKESKAEGPLLLTQRLTNQKVDAHTLYIPSNASPLAKREVQLVSGGVKLPVTTENKVLMELPQILDNLSYRSISLGFALLTIGILSGAVWANEAWGSYWSWDPKETWALITWLVFALYLHTRLSKGWVGKESAFVASFGFIVIWFCYLGVNLFGKGLHSYGWFQQ